MASLFEAITDRLKLVIATNATLDFEADLICANARRKGDLLAEARRLEAEGETELAAELRAHAMSIDLTRPASSAVHATNDITGECKKVLNGPQEDVEEPKALNAQPAHPEASEQRQEPDGSSAGSDPLPSEQDEPVGLHAEPPESQGERSVTDQSSTTEDETDDKPPRRGKGRKATPAKR